MLLNCLDWNNTPVAFDVEVTRPGVEVSLVLARTFLVLASPMLGGGMAVLVGAFFSVT